MKNERRNAQTKATHQNTEPVWDATGRARGKDDPSLYTITWAGQKNQDRPQRKRRRDPAPTHRKGRRPARDVLGQASPADADMEEMTIGAAFGPDKYVFRFVTNRPAWTVRVSRYQPLREHLDKWKRWARGEFNLVGRAGEYRELVPADPPVARCPARAPQVS